MTERKELYFISKSISFYITYQKLVTSAIPQLSSSFEANQGGLFQSQLSTVSTTHYRRNLDRCSPLTSSFQQRNISSVNSAFSTKLLDSSQNKFTSGKADATVEIVEANREKRWTESLPLEQQLSKSTDSRINTISDQLENCDISAVDGRW